MGPPRITLLRPKRSMMYPVGIEESARPARKITITSEAMPKLTSNDLAYSGIAGSAIPVPRAE